MTKTKSIYLFLIFLILSGFSLLPAQQESPESNETRIGPFSASDIAKQTETINSILQNSANLANPVPQVNKIIEQLPALIEKVEAIEKSASGDLLSSMKEQEISDLAQKCIVHETRFSEWQNILKNRIDVFENELVLLDKYLSAWQETNRISTQEKFPAEVVKTIKIVINSIREQSASIKTALNDLLKVQNSISKQEILLADIRSRLEKIQQESREGLFSIDSHPLWEVFSTEVEQPRLWSQYSMLYERHTGALKDFFQIYGSRIPYHLITLIAFFILFILLKRFSDKQVLEEDKAHILSHPFSSSVMISLFLTAVYYPQAPNIIFVMSASAIIIPIAILLPRSFKPRLRSITYFFIAVHLLQQVHLLAIENTLSQRIALLIITILVTVGTSIFLRSPRELILSQENRFWSAFRIFLYIAMILSVISILSNIIGNLSLADQITLGVMRSIYAALGITVVAQILVGLFTVMLYSQTASLLLLIREQKKVIRNFLNKLIYLAGFVLWAKVVLESFDVFDLFQQWYISFFSERWEIGSMSVSLGDIVAFILTIIFSVWLSKFIRFILEGDILPRVSLPRGVPATISMLANYTVLGFGFFIALSAAGIDLSKFALLAGALGVGIGFGLQNIVNNFISGLILIFERPIQVGDVVEVNQLRGTVSRIGIRSSTVRTFSGAEVIIPNANLISNEVVNWTLSDRMRRIEIPVGVAYGTDPNQVLGILKTIARNHEHVLSTPEPFVLFNGFGESSLDFELRFWTADFNTWMELKTNITLIIHDALKEAGIEIPFPQRDLHIKSKDAAPVILKQTESRVKSSDQESSPAIDAASPDEAKSNT